MKLLLIVAAVLGTCVIARLADATEAKPARPSVCLSYQLATGKDSKPFAICYDSDKPALFSRFAEVTVPGKEGAPIRVLVGWR